MKNKLFSSLFFSAGIVIAASVSQGVQAAAPAPKWSSAPQMGSFKVVAIDKKHQRKTAVYWEALRATCAPGSHCNVLFADAKELPGIRALPEREQREQALLIYTTNRGFEWNCRLRPEADNCFRWQ